MKDILDRMVDAAADLFGSGDRHHSIEVIEMTKIEVSAEDAQEEPAMPGSPAPDDKKDSRTKTEDVPRGNSAPTATVPAIRLISAAGKTFETRINFKIDRRIYKTIQSEYQYLQAAQGSYQFELVTDENSETGWSLKSSPAADLDTLLNDSVCEADKPYPLHSGDIIKIGSKDNAGVSAAPLSVSFEDSKTKSESAGKNETEKTAEPVKADETGKKQEPAKADETEKKAEPATQPPPEEDPPAAGTEAASTPEKPEETVNTEGTSVSRKGPTEEIWPKSAILARAKQAEKTVNEWIATYGSRFDQLEFAFNFVVGGPRVHVVYDPTQIPEELWFIGDLHGDILALDAALSYIDTHSISPTIVFLGDLFDRFDYGLEVVMRVISLVIERPGKIFWLAGNHDDGLEYRDGKFLAGYRPDEFAVFLNGHKEYEDFGKWLVKLMQQLPAVLFLPDGLFVAHGACPGPDLEKWVVPQPNLIDKVSSLEELENPDYLKCFIRYRFFNDVSPYALPGFMTSMERLTGFPVKRMLRGHDHCGETRHEFSQEAPVLTISTLSTWYLGVLEEPGDDERPRCMRKSPITTPAIAKFRSDELPEVITLAIPRSVVEQFYETEDLEPQNK